MSLARSADIFLPLQFPLYPSRVDMCVLPNFHHPYYLYHISSTCAHSVRFLVLNSGRRVSFVAFSVAAHFIPYFRI